MKMRLFALALLVVCAHATPQYVKTAGVKGGYSGRGYHAGENLVNNYYNNSTQHGYNGYVRTNLTESRNYEVGVCYIEVPTASLVRDPSHVPAGNGSRPDLSRIRTCCTGYIRNIHNYRICDPVCTQECVNGLCSAPNTCTCFPDHVKNLAGFCIPTCPIGCQNGQCAGGECICKDGYRLDLESKFCVPYCVGQCGGIGGGNCTAPNTCECKSGFKSSPDGSCKPACDRCKDGECVAPNECRCSPGFVKNQYGDCTPQCSSPCTPPSRCIAPNVCDNPANPVTITTPSPFGQPQINSPNSHNLTRVPYGQPPQYPNYPGYQQQNYPGYPGYQQPNYPGQQPNYPGNQQSYYPGNPENQQTGYPHNPQSNYPGYPQSNYPGNSQYPGSQPYPGQQSMNSSVNPQSNRPGSPSYYPGNQQNQSSHPSNYPGQRPSNYPDGQPIYVNIHNNQPLYPDSQHLGPDQRPNSNSTHGSPSSGYPNSQYYPGTQYHPEQQRPNYPNSDRPTNTTHGSPNTDYPNSQYYPGSQQQPDQRPNYPRYQQPENAEPYYPNSQYYPGSQHGYQDQNSYQNQHQYSSQSQGSEYQYIYSNSQSSAVEMLCSRPCINGTCVGRDTCACNTGFVPTDSDTSRCQPHCTGCSNGVCVSPFVCVCNPGYYKDFSVKGRASCVRRIRRSVDSSAPIDISKLLVFEIPDDYVN